MKPSASTSRGGAASPNTASAPCVEALTSALAAGVWLAASMRRNVPSASLSGRCENQPQSPLMESSVPRGDGRGSAGGRAEPLNPGDRFGADPVKPAPLRKRVVGLGEVDT